MRRHLLELVIIVAVVAVGVAVYRNSQPPPEDTLPELGEGLRLYKAHHYAEALPYFTEVLRRQPQLMQARLYRALSYQALGKVAEARADFETGKQNEPALVQYMFPRLTLQLHRESARLFIAEGKFPEALEDAKKSMTRSEIKMIAHSGGWPFDPDMAETYFVQGLAHAGLENWSEARSDFGMASVMGGEAMGKRASRHGVAVELLESGGDVSAAQYEYDESAGAEDDGCFLCQRLKPFEGKDGKLSMPAGFTNETNQ
jgi:hypothetical protein